MQLLYFLIYQIDIVVARLAAATNHFNEQIVIGRCWASYSCHLLLDDGRLDFMGSVQLVVVINLIMVIKLLILMRFAGQFEGEIRVQNLQIIEMDDRNQSVAELCFLLFC